jgi:2-dehydropantoate 2-reductase
LRALIFGAGGVGGYLGARLNQLLDVTFVARGKHLEVIQKSGLRLIDNKKESLFKVNAIDQSGLSGVYDLVLLTTKSSDLEGAIDAISNHISDKSLIIPIMNGVDNAKRIREKIKDVTVLDGCIYIISNIKEPGVIEKKGNIFKLCWGGKALEKAQHISTIFDEVGFFHKPSKNIELEVWRKFLFISPMALLTTFYSLDMYEIYHQKFDELKEAMSEVVKIANALGVELTSNDIQKSLTQASKVQKGAKTSMQLDVENSKASEIESLGGFVIKEAKRLGIHTPTLERIYTALKEMNSIK